MNSAMPIPNKPDVSVLKRCLPDSGQRLAASVFGDSVLRGVIYDEKAGGYRMYRGRFTKETERYPLEIRNDSRFGFTVERGAELIRQKITPEHHPEVVFLEYGGNDCNFDWEAVAAAPDDEHLPVVPEEKFLQIYGEVIDYVLFCGAMPVVVIPAPIDAEKFLSWICRKGLSREAILHWLGGTETIYRWQEYYAAMCRRLASERGCATLDLRTPFLCRHDYGSLICADGMHPTEKGHKLIDETFDRFFEEMKKG